MDKKYDAQFIADVLNISKSSILKAIKAGDLPADKVPCKQGFKYVCSTDNIVTYAQNITHKKIKGLIFG